MNRVAALGTALALTLASSQQAYAVFHLMQIEQVIGGVDGDTSVQAIQLRTRSINQNVVSGTRLVAVDATGANAVIVDNMTTNIANTNADVSILIATANFAAHTSPAAVPDFVLDNPIPASYLAAGCLSFENDAGTQIIWRLCWGGGGYTGPTTGLTFNDVDGQFAPPYAGALPSADATALRFIGLHTAPSTNNAADYALTAGPATFENSFGNTFVVQSSPGTDAPVVASSRSLISDLRVMPNPFSASTRLEMTLARRADARWVIVDTLGRRVHESARALPAGSASLSWDGRNAHGGPLPSGVYFYRLEIGEDVRNGQLILIR